MFIKVMVGEHDFVFSDRGKYYILEDHTDILMVVKSDKKLWIHSYLYEIVSNFFNLTLIETNDLIIEAINYGWKIDCNSLYII
jgi:hypothetical protein